MGNFLLLQQLTLVPRTASGVEIPIRPSGGTLVAPPSPSLIREAEERASKDVVEVSSEEEAEFFTKQRVVEAAQTDAPAEASKEEKPSTSSEDPRLKFLARDLAMVSF